LLRAATSVGSSASARRCAASASTSRPCALRIAPRFMNAGASDGSSATARSAAIAASSSRFW
jgi:hypothetical protein